MFNSVTAEEFIEQLKKFDPKSRIVVNDDVNNKVADPFPIYIQVNKKGQISKTEGTGVVLIDFMRSFPRK